MKSNPKATNEFDNFREFVRKVVNVPGATVKRQIKEEKEARARKKRAKTSPASRVSRAKD